MQTTEEALVSIIIPVHNAGEYLPRCIDSVLGQEYRNFELLLADDGSTDDSGSICDSYASRDPRVRVLHKPNTGVSDTRNQALDLARGTYIQFVDSDDWISPEATRMLVRSMEMNRCDLVISDFYRVSGDHFSRKGDISETHVLTREEFSAFMMENPADFYYGVLWNKLYKRKIIQDQKIRMDPRIDWCEDFLFNLEYIRHAHTFYALQTPLYYYVRRKGSLSSGASLTRAVKMKISVFEYYNEFYKDIYDQEDYKNIRPQIYKFFLSIARDGSVIPLPLPGVQKLEKAKKRIHGQALTDRGLLMDSYRFRKLLEYQLHTVAKKHRLTPEESMLLYCFHFVREFRDIRELSDFAGFSPQKTSSLIQKLIKKGLISKTASRQQTSFSILPDAFPILKDFDLVEQDFDSIRLSSLSPSERQLYQELTARTQENIADFLSHL